MASRLGIIVLGVVAVSALAVVAWFATRPADVPVAGSLGETPVATSPAAPSPEPKAAPRRERTIRGGGSGAVVGLVRVFGTDAPVGGATVTLTSGDVVLDTRSEADGSFAIPKVPASDAWTLRVVPSTDLGDADLVGLVVAQRKTTDVGVVYLAPGFAVPGIVEDEHGAPIAGAEVQALRPRSEGRRLDVMSMFRDLAVPIPAAGTTRSGDDGRFRLGGVPPGAYTIVARKSGFAPGVLRSVLVAPASQQQTIRIVLERSFRLDGKVVRKGGVPVPDVTVVAFPTPSVATLLDLQMPSKAIVRTDGDGQFSFDGLASGKWNVVAAPPGEAMASRDDVHVPQTSFVELRLESVATLRGRVTGEGDAPLAGAQVYAAAEKFVAHAQTDPAGRFELRGLPADSLQMFMVTADGYCPYPSGGLLAMMAAETHMTLQEGVNTKDVQLVAGGKVRGVVVEEGTKTAVPGATATLFSPSLLLGGSPVATTDADGKFEIAGVPVGASMLCVRKAGWCHREAPDTESMLSDLGSALMGGEKDSEESDPGTGVRIVVAKGGDVVERTVGLLRSIRLTGRVVGPTGEPVTGARVSVRKDDVADTELFPVDLVEILGGPDTTRLTDAHGRFDVDSPIPQGKVRLAASATGFVAVSSAAIEVGPAVAPPETELRLGVSGTIEGRVSEPSGAPVAGARVRFSANAPSDDVPELEVFASGRLLATTGADGSYRLTGVAPGRYLLEVEEVSHVAASKADVEVPAGTVARADVTLDPAVSIGGHVVRADGTAADVRWVIATPSDPTKGASEDADASPVGSPVLEAGGRFRMNGLRPGSYRLVARVAGGQETEPVVAEAGAGDVELRLAVALTISGTVRFKSGGPASGVEVTALPSSEDGPSDRTFSAVSDENGAFVIGGVTAGPYELAAVPYAITTARTNVRPVRLKDVAAGSSGVVIEVEPGLTITGRVLLPDGKPAPEGSVTARRPATPPSDLESDGATDEDEVELDADVEEGRFEVVGLDTGTWRVTIDVEGLAATTLTVEAGAKDVVFRMTRGGTIKGRVLGPDGKPVEGATVDVNDDTVDYMSSPSAETDGDGAFVLELVAPGAHRLTAYWSDAGGESYEGEVKDVHVLGEHTAEGVEIRLRKAE